MLHLRGRLRAPRFPSHGISQFRLHLSSLSSAHRKPAPPEPIPRPSSLSARMNFVFDQIDAIERERSQKDQTLQRIRAWRESKKNKEIAQPAPAPERKFQEFELVKRDESVEKNVEENVGLLGSRKEVELVHPWPEWIEFMERLVQQNYFDHKRKDEQGMIENLGFNLPEMVEEEGFDFTRDFKTVQTAVLNFGKDRFDVMRSLSRQDLQMLVGYGCPSADKKVVFSSKLLRKHVHLDEGDVCSSCSLRSTCERAYLITNKEDEARTIDVVRVLLAYGFDAVNGSVTNKSLLKMKSVKNAVRKLIHDVVRLSAVPIDPNLPPPIIKKPPPKVKQPPPPPRKRVGRDDIEMKKGDWLCAKCDFMNFAKNTMCLQCDANRPKRQLLPGEWECPQCNFLNYRRNTVCFHCDHKRPPEEFVENPEQERRQQSHRRLEKVSGGPEVSNTWNFDFDDNESDGADVAAFEYADPKMMREDLSQDNQAPRVGPGRGGREEGFYNPPPRSSDREYSGLGMSKPRLGFDDFDDEDDDDLDSYEVDTRNEINKGPTVSLSELEVDSSEDDNPPNHDRAAHRKSGIQTKKKPSDLFSDDEDDLSHNRNARPRAQNNASQPRRRGFSGSDDEIDFGSDDDLPIHPKWKSSRVNQRSKVRGSMSYGSENDSDFSDEDDFGTKQKKSSSPNRNSRKQQRFDDDDEGFSDAESNNHSRFEGKSFRGGSAGSNGRGKPNDSGVDRRKSSTTDSFGRSSVASRGRSFEDGDRGGGFRSPRGGGGGNGRSPRGGGGSNGRSPRGGGGGGGGNGRSFRGGGEGNGRSFRGGGGGNGRSFRGGGGGSYNKQRDDRFGNSNKEGGHDYLDDQRFRKPRVNVR